MSKTNLLTIGLFILIATVGCKSITSLLPGKKSATKDTTVDIEAPASPWDVLVTLDKKQTATGKVTRSGGSVTLSTADGSKFTLDVPANAVDSDSNRSLNTSLMTDIRIRGFGIHNKSP